MSWSRSLGQNFGSGATEPSPVGRFPLINITLDAARGDVDGALFSFSVADPKTPTRRRLVGSLLAGDEALMFVIVEPLGDKASAVRLKDGEEEGEKEELGRWLFWRDSPRSSNSDDCRGDDGRVPSPCMRELNFLLVAFIVR